MAENLRGPALAEAQKLLTPYLDPGEKLIWAERTNLWSQLPYVRILFFSFFCLFPLFIISASVSRGTLTTQPLTPAIGVLFFTVGASMLFSSFRDVPTIFSLSNERAFILKTRSSFSLFSIPLALIGPTSTNYAELGKGSIIFNVSVWLNDHENGPKILPGRIGFFGIENVREVEALIKKYSGAPSKNSRIFSHHPLVAVPKKFRFSFSGGD